MTSLLSFIEYAAESMDNNIQLDAIYTDFSKAFDKVNTNLLLKKIESFGIGGTVHNWFESYLRYRSQCVKFGGSMSQIMKPSSGVPQGFILGPFLFTIFIADLPDCLRSRNLGYADDFKLFRQIRSREDCNILQSDFVSLKDWCVKRYGPKHQ